MRAHITNQRDFDLSPAETPFPIDALKLIVVIPAEDCLQWKIISLLKDRNVTAAFRRTGLLIYL